MSTSTPRAAGEDAHDADADSASAFVTGAGLTPQDWSDVVAPPAELAAACAECIEHDGVLDVAQLQELVQRIVERPDIWEPLVVVDPHRRRYRLLYEDERIDIWVLSWMPGQATGFHDHDLSGVGLACAQGEVCERQMLLPNGATSNAMVPGVVSGGPAGYIHSVQHASGAPAITIHAYSPRLDVVGQYKVDDDGVLRRDVMNGRQELLDHTIATIDPDRA